MIPVHIFSLSSGQQCLF